jgi:hypothetical protein
VLNQGESPAGPVQVTAEHNVVIPTLQIRNYKIGHRYIYKSKSVSILTSCGDHQCPRTLPPLPPGLRKKMVSPDVIRRRLVHEHCTEFLQTCSDSYIVLAGKSPYASTLLQIVKFWTF